MTNPDSSNQDPNNPPPPGITRPPIGKPKLKLTPKGGKKQGTRPSLKLGGNKPLPVTQPPFKKQLVTPPVESSAVSPEQQQAEAIY